MGKVIISHPAAPCRLPLTEAALCAWVGRASPGDQIVYYRGFLAVDVAPDSKRLTPSQRQELRAVAGRAWKLAQDGLVHLVQRREDGGAYSYILLVTRQPRGAGGALSKVLLAADFDVVEPLGSKVPARRRA